MPAIRKLLPRFKLSPDIWVTVLALAYVGGYAIVAVQRVFYPYDIDFIEDSMLMQAWQAALGRPVFVPPNADFVPQVYMPLYTWLGGLIFRITGPGYLPLRLLSLGATLVAAVVIFWIGWKIAGEKTIAFLAAGLFLAGYRTTGGWYELARVDALYGMLTLLGAAVAVYGADARGGPALAGGFLALSFLTKQNGLAFAVVVAVFYLLAYRRRFWPLALSFLLLAGLPVAWLQLSSHGWFGYYVFHIAYLSPIEPGRITAMLQTDLFGSMAGLSLLLATAGASLVRRERWKSLMAEPWYWIVGAAVLISIAGRASVGGNRNNLMIGYAFLCLSPALLAKEIRCWRPQVQREGRLAVLACVALQFALTSITPRYPAPFIPTPQMRAAGDRLIDRIAGVDGPVLVLMHPYYASLAGKQPAAHIQMLWHARARGREPLPPDLVRRIQNQYYAEIISDESAPFESDPALVSLLLKYYVLVERLPADRAPPTLTGLTVRPRHVYVPRP